MHIPFLLCERPHNLLFKKYTIKHTIPIYK